MHFIKLTKPNNESVYVNAEKILEIPEQRTINKKTFTRIVMAFEVDGDYAFTDVLETPDEIMEVL